MKELQERFKIFAQTLFTSIPPYHYILWINAEWAAWDAEQKHVGPHMPTDHKNLDTWLRAKYAHCCLAFGTREEALLESCRELLSLVEAEWGWHGEHLDDSCALADGAAGASYRAREILASYNPPNAERTLSIGLLKAKAHVDEFMEKARQERQNEETKV